MRQWTWGAPIPQLGKQSWAAGWERNWSRLQPEGSLGNQGPECVHRPPEQLMKRAGFSPSTTAHTSPNPCPPTHKGLPVISEHLWPVRVCGTPWKIPSRWNQYNNDNSMQLLAQALTQMVSEFWLKKMSERVNEYKNAKIARKHRLLRVFFFPKWVLLKHNGFQKVVQQRNYKKENSNLESITLCSNTG